MSDNVNNPKHYTSHPSGIECLTIVRHMGFNLGNAVKYIWRASLKGKEIEDLEKAIFYLKDEIARLSSAGLVDQTKLLPCDCITESGGGGLWGGDDLRVLPLRDCVCARCENFRFANPR